MTVTSSNALPRVSVEYPCLFNRIEEQALWNLFDADNGFPSNDNGCLHVNVFPSYTDGLRVGMENRYPTHGLLLVI